MPSGQVPSSRPQRTRYRVRAGSAGPENKEAADHSEKLDLPESQSPNVEREAVRDWFSPKRRLRAGPRASRSAICSP
jgi:hypothetical protein